jgi:hypothetical protein
LFVFWTGSFYVAQLVLNSQLSCLSLPCTGITAMHHHAWQRFFSFFIRPEKLEF